MKWKPSRVVKFHYDNVVLRWIRYMIADYLEIVELIMGTRVWAEIA